MVALPPQRMSAMKPTFTSSRPAIMDNPFGPSVPLHPSNLPLASSDAPTEASLCSSILVIASATHNISTVLFRTIPRFLTYAHSPASADSHRAHTRQLCESAYQKHRSVFLNGHSEKGSQYAGTCAFQCCSVSANIDTESRVKTKPRHCDM